MIRRKSDYYSYIFQEESGVTAALFTTMSGTKYRCYFYPAKENFQELPTDTLLYEHGYVFGLTKLAPDEGKKEGIDFGIRNTVIAVINKFFSDKGVDKILIFHCDDDDINDNSRSSSKRALCFDNWYKTSDAQEDFNKYDEEFDIESEDGNMTIYTSLIVSTKNSNSKKVILELPKLKDYIITNK